MHSVSKYSTRIAYSDEDQGFIATVPELPGCSAFGETAAESLTEIVPAIEAWISAAEAAGNPIPPPASLDAELPSGKFLVRVAKTVHAQLTVAAQREGVSLNQYVGTILATASLGDIYTQAYSRAVTGDTATAMTTTSARADTASGYSMIVMDAPSHITNAGFTAHVSSAKSHREIYTLEGSTGMFKVMSVDVSAKRRSRTTTHG